MTAFATHKPEMLQDELRSTQEAIGAVDRPLPDVAALRARGEALAARIEHSGAFPEITRA